MNVNPMNYGDITEKLKASFINPLKALDELRRLDLATCDDLTILSLIRKLGRFAMIEQTIHAGEGSIIERARPNHNGEIFTLFDQISYNSTPPNEYRRCTLPGSIVFYGALPVPEINDTRIISAAETSEILGLENESGEHYEEYMTNVRWQVVKDLKCIALLGKKEFLEFNSSLLNTRETLETFIKNYSEQEVEKTNVINEFLAHEFGKKVKKSEPYLYKISAMFSDFVFKQGFAGIIYPSVGLGGAGLNIALRKEIIDDGYILPTIAVQMKNYALGKNFVSDNPYHAVYRDGKFIWNDTPYNAYAGRAACLKILYESHKSAKTSKERLE